MRATLFVLTWFKTVSQQSATMVGKRMVYLSTDHTKLNKFRGEDDENFRLFVRELEELVSSARERKHEGTQTTAHKGTQTVR